MTALQTQLLGVSMKNPVIAASGTFGFGREYEAFFDPGLLGGISSKGLTLHGSKGNKGVRVWETPAGLLNSIGLENPACPALSSGNCRKCAGSPARCSATWAAIAWRITSRAPACWTGQTSTFWS